MTDRPIIFSAPMVRALMDGRKTQTRRLLSLPTKTHSGGPIYERPDMGRWAATTHGGEGCFTVGKDSSRLPVPERPGLWHQTTGTCVVAQYDVGDRLFVREAFSVRGVYSDVVEVGYRAHENAGHTQFVEQWPVASAVDGKGKGPAVTWPLYKPSIHMPRWASRITLMVTDVRVERLQDISESDALAEGIGQHGRFFGLSDADWDDAELTAQAAFRRLWNSLHAAPGTTWEANPWLIAVTFEVIRANIDTLEPPTAASGASASAVSPLDQRAKEAGALVGEPNS